MARPKNCGKCSKPKRPKGKHFKGLPGYCECGRPTVFTPDVIQKLEDAFKYDFPDIESCVYANISPAAFYKYQSENPEFKERKEQIRLKPNMKARETIVKSLGEINNAWRWLSRKDPMFMPVSKIQHSGIVEVAGTEIERSPEEKRLLTELQEARRKRIEDNSDKMESPI